MLTDAEREAKIALGLRLKQRYGPAEKAHRRYVMQGITFETPEKKAFVGHLNYKKCKPGTAGLPTLGKR